MNQPNKRPKMQTTLSNDTLVSVGAVVAVFLFAVPLTWKLSKLFGTLNTSIERLTEAIEDRIEHKDLVNWIRLTRAQNPDLDIPQFPEKK